MSIKIGCGQITWMRYSAAGAEWVIPEAQVLEEIASAGYDGAPAGLGKHSPEETIAEFARLGMHPAPGYFSADFWVADQQAAIVAAATEFARYTQALGLTEMYVATGGWEYVSSRGKNRNQLAGQVTSVDGLSDAEMDQFAATLTAACRATMAFGVRCCFHNHVGTVIETRAELERLLERVPADLLFLGPDTGHFAWAGDDAVAFCRDYASRIKTIHIKDINQDVAVQGRSAGWDYRAFSAHGIWAEVGHGVIDFRAVFESLQAAGFDGWAIVETDVTQLGSPAESARVSREYLRSIGF